MGKKIVDIFDALSKEKGAGGTTRLILMTGVNPKKALEIPETPELMKKFADGYQEIAGKPCPIK